MPSRFSIIEIFVHFKKITQISLNQYEPEHTLLQNLSHKKWQLNILLIIDGKG